MRTLTMNEVQDVNGAGFWAEVFKTIAGEIGIEIIKAGIGQGNPDEIVNQQINAPAGTFG